MNYGPPLKVERTEKEWNPAPSLKKYKHKIRIKSDISYFYLMLWLYDGKFYGAEWIEEDSFDKLKGLLAPYITEYEDPVEVVKRVRDANIYED